MSGRVTRTELDAAFRLMVDAAVKAGVTEAARWRLDIGSKTYGRAYRVWLKHEDESFSGHYTPLVHDFLGMTAAEAVHTLRSYRSAFQAVTWATEGMGR